MADGFAVDQARVITNLRRRHAEQLDTATFEAAQWRAAAEQLQEENERLTARLTELTQPDG